MKSINKHNFILGLSIFLLINYSIFEVHFFVFLVITLLYYSSISRDLFYNLTFLFTIILIGSLAAIFQSQTAYNFIRDLLYFIKPILALVSGYLIAKKISDLSRILRVIIYLTTAFAIVHIYSILSEVDFATASISEIRKVGGISNLPLVFALSILVSSYKHFFLNVIKVKILKIIILIILSLSFTLYFSRTMLVCFILLMLASYGYIKITRKGLKYILFTLLGFTCLYIYLFNTEIEREKPGIESFLYKLKNAPSEIFTPFREIDQNNHAYLWDHWRAYEATLAFDQINTASTIIIGKGFGALVDLKFRVQLGPEKMRYIPALHNGYMNIYFKTGILGFVIYIIFLISIYLFTYSKSSNNKNYFFNNIIAGIGMYFIFSSLIINGIYNIEDIVAFLLGILFFFKAKTTLKNDIS